MDSNSESRLYVGNLDHRVTESNLIRMFTPFGKIVSEHFLWHTQGPKRGVPRGYAFIQFSTKEEAKEAKMKMNGRMACGRPLVVRFASEKTLIETRDHQTGGAGCSSSDHTNRSKTIAAIKSKLRSLEEEENQNNSKKPKNS